MKKTERLSKITQAKSIDTGEETASNHQGYSDNFDENKQNIIFDEDKKNVIVSPQNHTIASSKPFFSAATIAKVAALTAVSWILYMFIKFPLPAIFPQFLEMQISDLPALIGGYALGPVCGCLIVVLKCLLKMPFTSTACVGEIADILVGVAFVLTTSLIYKRNKTRKGAFWGLVVGVFASVFVAIVMNRFVLVPFYVELFFEGNFGAIVNMVSTLYKSVTESNFYFWYLLLGVVPFNLLRCFICGVITFGVYKSISKLLHR